MFKIRIAGAPYASLTPQQQTLVDTVWFNIMAYHSRDILSPCQLNRMSTQGYLDRSWIYSKEPVYVDRYSTAIFEFGSFVFPYKAFDTALNAPGINGKIIVLQAGDYTTAQDAITKEVDIVTRFADSAITRSGLDKVLFELPADLANSSKSDRVRSALKSVKRFDKEKKAESGSRHSSQLRNMLKAGRRSLSNWSWRRGTDIPCAIGKHSSIIPTLQKRLNNRI